MTKEQVFRCIDQMDDRLLSRYFAIERRLKYGWSMGKSIFRVVRRYRV